MNFFRPAMRFNGVALLPLLTAAAGCADHSDAGATTFESTLPLVWVDPARCLPSCTHTEEPDLVGVDASARLGGDGTFSLRRDAQPALAALIDAAAGAGLTITIGDAHRTYEHQGQLWDDNVVKEPGRSARPGHSEHEAGLAVDLNFAPDAAIDWTATNAWRFGFVLSYPQYEQKTTGFRYESWHFRFVGSAIAADLHDRPGLTEEEWFRMSPGRGVSGDCSDCTLPASRADCGPLTAAGECDGNLLSWCFDGTATTVDCTTSGLVCVRDAQSTSAACGDPP